MVYVIGVITAILFLIVIGISKLSDTPLKYFDYVKTECRQGTDWVLLIDLYDHDKAALVDHPPKPRAGQRFSFGADSISYHHQWGKYANDLDKVQRIEVTADTIHIWVDPAVSKRPDGYIFHNVTPECRQAFVNYVQADPVLSDVLTLAEPK